MALMLTCKDVSVAFPTKTALSCVTMSVEDGDRIGIVGTNGSGKSTLLGLMAGTLEPDTGDVTRRSDITVGLLNQEDPFRDEDTVHHCVVGTTDDYVWQSDPRTREVVDTLLKDVVWEAPLSSLSGGQRRRVDLARLLIGDWDVLLLDEPTNHLDIETITWLAGHLATRWTKAAGALLVITHDRWFLDEVCHGMWEVHDGQVDPYEGGYSAYVMRRVERQRLEEVAAKRRKNILRKELAWLARGAKARTSKPRFRVDAALELIADEPPVRDSLDLKQAAMTRLGKKVIAFEDVSVAFGDQTVLDHLDWIMGPGERIGILGMNGAGKTTLLQVIAGTLQPTSGRIVRGKTVKVAALTQRLDELKEVEGDLVREVLGRYKTRYLVGGKNLTPAQLLERLGFERTHLQARVADLSGGQRRRLQLLLVLLEEPNVLILDEPGNDMDTDMLAVMEDLFDSWPGTLIAVSHDRYLMERITDDLFALIDGTVRHLPGGVDEYLHLASARSSARGGTGTRTAAQRDDVAPSGRFDDGSADGASAGTTSAEKEPSLSGGEGWRLRKTLAQTERKMETLAQNIAEAQAHMHEAAPTDFMLLGKLEEEMNGLRTLLAEQEELWFELSEKLQG